MRVFRSFSIIRIRVIRITIYRLLAIDQVPLHSTSSSTPLRVCDIYAILLIKIIGCGAVIMHAPTDTQVGDVRSFKSSIGASLPSIVNYGD